MVASRSPCLAAQWPWSSRSHDNPADLIRRAGVLGIVRAAGAVLVVSPTVDGGVLRATLALGLASIPGAGSVTEFAYATTLGAHFVTVFPATVFSPVGIGTTLARVGGVRRARSG